MRRFIAAHEATRQPILVLDDDGRLVGKVGESELVARLLRGKDD
jgi:glycine betaine/proline transport system ATP-binding protein